MIVQVGSGQNFTGSNMRGSSAVPLDFNDFPNLLVPEMNVPKSNRSSSGESGAMDPDQSFFVGKGLNGVYLEISIPVAWPEPAITEELSPRTESDSFHQVCHFDGSQRSIKSPIPAFRTGPFDRLFDAVGGKNAVNHRFPGLQADIFDPF